MKTNLKQLSRDEMISFFEGLGERPYRARQVINWIYKKFTTSFDEMTDLPKSLRSHLKETAFISELTLLKKEASRDGTEKFLFGLIDGEAIESVLIPDKKRLTLCISSQVGCAMGCRFCETGRMGLRRNLMAYEIVDQVIAAQQVSGQTITNVVLMGMGEPLDNIDEVIKALWRLTSFMGISKRRITVSTAGLIPGIQELAERGPGVNLAISLNATTDDVRSRIMPINKRYPIHELMKACREFPLPPRRRITFEYVLLEGINDSEDDALRLVRLLRGIRAKVNLIPYNPVSTTIQGERFRRPPEERILSFQQILIRSGITALVRKSRGTDISAACGQLRTLRSSPALSRQDRHP